MNTPIKMKILSEFQKNNFYNGNLSINWNLENSDTLDKINKFYFFKYLKFELTWDFEENKNYIFPIFIDNISTSIDELNFFCDKVRNFINGNKNLFLNKTLIPVFLDPLEGNRHVGSSINRFVNYFDDIEFYHISADYNLTKENNKFKFIYNDQWKYHIIPSESTINYSPKKDYINLNRMPRLHRCLLMQQLIDNSLLDKGYNTWALAKNNNPSSHSLGFFEQFKTHYPNNTIENQTYDILDVVEIDKQNPTFEVPVDHCRESFIYIVTETHIDTSIFLSEKTYKPIAIGMPFMLLGTPGTLNHLREIGYVTFSDWIDESYDMDLPLDKRIDIIIHNLIKISKMPDIQKINLRRQMNEVCKHNLDLYKLLNRKNNLIETLKLIEKKMI